MRAKGVFEGGIGSDLISLHHPLLHDPAPYSMLICTSYPGQSTPHTLGILSLSSPALLCAFFTPPCHFLHPGVFILFCTATCAHSLSRFRPNPMP